MIKSIGCILFFCLLTINALAQQNVSKSTGAVKVELKKTETGFQLYRDGKPYYILGAGGSGHLSRLASYGGNSIRTWSTGGAERILDSAHKNGLTVLLGLDVARERHGFDYNDESAVKVQLEKLKQEVIKYKDHPALLAWGIGNELNLHYTNKKVWDAVNDISKMIHDLDKNHPTSTQLAGINKDLSDIIKQKCPDLDLLGINTYGGLESLPNTIQDIGYEGAYMVTEWGPTGHWESLQTSWNMPVEETSSEKAAVYKRRYEYSMNRDKKQCVGSYVFLWGQKQERTPTWYGIFTEAGEESEVVDVMQYLWSGKWPANQAPHLYSLRLDNKKVTDNIHLATSKKYTAEVVVMDPDHDKLSYRWELLPEPTKVGEGGDREDRPVAVQNAFSDKDGGKISLKSPSKPGPYRLFVYVTDGNNNVATANIPFMVK